MPGGSGGKHVGDEVQHGVDLTLMGIDLGQIADAFARLDLASRAGFQMRELSRFDLESTGKLFEGGQQDAFRQTRFVFVAQRIKNAVVLLKDLL